jgi:hypothetical protein
VGSNRERTGGQTVRQSDLHTVVVASGAQVLGDQEPDRPANHGRADSCMEPLHGRLSAHRYPTLIRDRISREEWTVSKDQQDTSAADDQPSPSTAAEFDREFSTVDRSSGLRRVWQRASPDLPPEVEPYSFVSAALLDHVADALALAPGTTLVDLGCGRGGPGLWLAQSHGAMLIALHFAVDPTAAAREALRLLRPGGRLALTNWQPRSPADARLPGRLRIDWADTLGSAGFAEVRVESRQAWHHLFTRVFQVALELGDPGNDVGLASLQDEARQALPKAHLVDRVVATATRPVDGIGL